MNQDNRNWPVWYDRSSRAGATDLWSSITDFIRRQPEYVLAGGLVGGALLAFLLKNSTDSPQSAYSHPTQRSAPPFRQRDSRRERRSWRYDHDGPWRMPSARLGATEDQMEELATPSSHALESGSAGATGSAYDLDPNSITGG